MYYITVVGESFDRLHVTQRVIVIELVMNGVKEIIGLLPGDAKLAYSTPWLQKVPSQL